MDIDIEKICRTCLGLSGPLLSIYDGSNGGAGCLADQIKSFTKTKPRRADNMPEKVCLACISEINRCYSFKLKCENSDRTLRQLLPEALSDDFEKADRRGEKVEQFDRWVQTTSADDDKSAITVDVQTQTMQDAAPPVLVHQEVQTLDEQVQRFEKATSPLIIRDIKLVEKKIKFKQERGQDYETVHQYAKTQANDRRNEDSVYGTVKRKRCEKLQYAESECEELEVVDEEEEPNDHEIYLEIENDNIRNEERYAPIDETNQASANANEENTSYYEWSSTHDDDGEGGTTNIVAYAGGNNQVPEDGDENGEFTQIIYREDGVGGTITNQQDYNFTIYNNEHGETEIVAKQPFKSTSKLSASSRVVVVPATTEKTFKYEYKCPECVMTFVSERNLKRHLVKRHNWTDGQREWAGFAAKKQKVALTNEIQTNQLQQLKDEIQNDKKVETESAKVGKEKWLADISASINATTPPPPSPQAIAAEATPVAFTFFCDRCNAGFALRKSLICHRKLNACTVLTYKCDECERVFISEENLKEHKVTHLLCNRCCECNKVYESKDQLTQHMIDEHKRKIRNQCNICKKVFTMLSALKDHMRVHSGEKPFLCPHCFKAFSQNANLKQHIMRHSNEKKFQCDECQNSYVTKAELFSHKRSHTGDQPFQCEYCQANFTTSSSLVKHKRKHTGERPYGCEICPMRFSALNVLKNHRRTHTGEKPYKCIYCSQGFTQKGDCQIHQRKHTGERNFTCYCGQKYINLGTLRSHMKNHEKSKITPKKRACTAGNEESSNTTAVHIAIVDANTDNANDDGVAIAPTTDSTEEQMEAANDEDLMQIAMNDLQ